MEVDSTNPPTATSDTVAHDLFGGAIKTILPADFLDVSNFREVPDNQEIFVSNSAHEISIMIDILERADVPDNAAAEYHFDAIATDNEVEFDNLLDWRVFGSFYVPTNLHEKLPGVECFSVRGFQRVVKGHYKGATDRGVNGVRTGEASSSSAAAAAPQLEKEYVLVYIAVFRLGEKNTDIVVSMNLPVRAEEGIQALTSDDGSVLDNYLRTAPGVCSLEPIMLAIVENFEIVDWSLFDVDQEEGEYSQVV